MKITRAQELLEFIRGDLRNGPHKERVKAVEMGIGALKRIRHNRGGGDLFTKPLLPSETEE